ncbi:class I glutamine amidotransferase-like protein [Xylariaceae sp. FL0804]|nr:class I glutamine amidotransferase-like protein [Xylariaceae sp. FL0804]
MVTVGVLALQGGFAEHLSSLRKAAQQLPPSPSKPQFEFAEVRTPSQLATCDALVIPGGESTTLSLVAAQSGLLEPLREFVTVRKKPTWGTCAGLILLSREASATKRGGQELIGGLDVRVHRNHFGRQMESFVTDMELPFLLHSGGGGGGVTAGQPGRPFPAVFIRAPVVDRLLADDHAMSAGDSATSAPAPDGAGDRIEVLATLPGRHASNTKAAAAADGGPVVTPLDGGAGDIVALRQGNVVGTSFHPELTDDVRIHVWWLDQVVRACASSG